MKRESSSRPVSLRLLISTLAIIGFFRFRDSLRVVYERFPKMFKICHRLYPKLKKYSTSTGKQIYLEKLQGGIQHCNSPRGTAVLHMNRPEAKNALGREFMTEFKRLLRDLRFDEYAHKIAHLEQFSARAHSKIKSGACLLCRRRPQRKSNNDSKGS